MQWGPESAAIVVLLHPRSPVDAAWSRWERARWSRGARAWCRHPNQAPFPDFLFGRCAQTHSPHIYRPITALKAVTLVPAATSKTRWSGFLTAPTNGVNEVSR